MVVVVLADIDLHPDRMVVSAREQGRARRRAERRRVEAKVLQPTLRQPFGCRRVARTAERRGGSEARIVDTAISTFAAPVGGRSGTMGGYFVFGSLASYVVSPTGLGSGIGRMSRFSAVVGCAHHTVSCGWPMFVTGAPSRLSPALLRVLWCRAGACRRRPPSRCGLFP